MLAGSRACARKKGASKPRSASPSGNEPWAITLEKARAKWRGSRAKLPGGAALWGWLSMTGDSALQLSAGPRARKWAREGVVAIKGKQGRRARGFRVTKEKCSSDNLWTLLKKCDKQKALTSAPAGKAGHGRAVASAASLRGRLRS